MLIAYRLNLNILRDDRKVSWRKQAPVLKKSSK